MLRLIGNQAGELIVVHLFRALWKEFCERNWCEIKKTETMQTNNEKKNYCSFKTQILSNTIKNQNQKFYYLC